jgi:hypothetical protein
MEEYSYYIDTADGLRAFEYHHLVVLVKNGTFSLEKKVTLVDNCMHEQRVCKLKDIL